MIVLKKVDEFCKSCLDDIKRQIEVQKIYINSSHPDFDHYKRMIAGSKASGATQENDEAEDEENQNVGDDSDDNDGSSSLFDSAADLGMGLAGIASGDPISIRTIVKGARGLFSAMQQKSEPQPSFDEGVIRLRKNTIGALFCFSQSKQIICLI